MMDDQAAEVELSLKRERNEMVRGRGPPAITQQKKLKEAAHPNEWSQAHHSIDLFILSSLTNQFTFACFILLGWN